MPRLLVFQHVAAEPLGTLDPLIRRRGHRIRLEISGGNFPRFDRNPNAFVPVAGAVRLRRSTQTVYRDRARPSHLVLPLGG